MENSRSSEDPFFIFYDARSGSTFLASLLTRDYKVLIPPETNFVTDLLSGRKAFPIHDEQELDKAMDIIRADRKFADLGLDNMVIRANLSQDIPLSLSDVVRIILGLYSLNFHHDDWRIGIKKGSYLHHYRDLSRLFPKSKFVGLIRDGRAVFSSKKRSIYSVTGKPMEVNPKRAAKLWVERIDLIRKMEKEKSNSLIIRYEELVKNTDQITARVAEFIGARRKRWEENETTYAITSRYGEDLHRNIKHDGLAERISAWKFELSKEEIVDFESVARKTLVQEGYELCFC